MSWTRTGRAWVVGASSGIGAATARELTARGAQVTISARRAEALQEVSAGAMDVVPLDVTDPQAVAAAWRQVSADGPPDLVLYCAGTWKQSRPGTFDGAEFREHVEVNLLGMGSVLDLAVPAMVQRGAGTIAVVASVAGFRGVPGGDSYGATKAAQINLLEAMRGPLRARGVDAVTVCPGFVDTPMTRENDFPMPFMISPQEAAREICDGLEAGRAELVFPLRMAALMKTARVLPTRLWTALGERSGRG